MRWLVTIALLLTGSASIFAQNEQDILRLSETSLSGNSRLESMAGSAGAMGGSPATVHINPATNALLSRSEYGFSSYLRFGGASTSHYDQSMQNGASSLRVANLSGVFTLKEKSGDWNYLNIGFSFSNLNDWKSTKTFEGVNNESSLLDYFFNQVLDNQGNNITGIDTDYPFGASLAWNTFLLDTFNGYFFTANPSYGHLQTNVIEEQGRQNETSFSFSANNKHRFYLGGAINIRSVNFNRTSAFTEEINANDTSTFLNSFTFEEELGTQGSGYNANFGLIYRPSEQFRIGLAYQTPTYYNLTDFWTSAMTSYYEGGQFFEDESYLGNFEYNMITPGKLTGSAAIMLGRRFAINGDLEFIDHGRGRLLYNGSRSIFNAENTATRQNFRSVINTRVGVEYRLSSYSIRAGYAHQPSIAQYDPVGDRQTYAFGFGNNLENFFWDVALSYRTQGERSTFLYDPEVAYVAPSSFQQSNFRTTVSIGFRIQ